MPIHINLLAERHALEEERRRDPAKRSMWVGGFLAALGLLWAVYLQLQITSANSALKQSSEELKIVDKKSRIAAANLKKTADLEQKLTALRALATNRFLWAQTLDALQFAVVPDIQMVRLHGEHAYTMIEQRASVGSDGKLKHKPPVASERIVIVIEAKDFAPGSELNHNKLISEIVNSKVLKEGLRRNDAVTLKERLPSQPDPADPGRNYIPFSIECRYPEKQRLL